MITVDSLKSQLQKAFPQAMVSVSSEDNVHFSVSIIDEGFAALSRVKRHQAVYAHLGDEISSGALHALQLSTLTPEEAR